ncbi:MAG: hypothetical protein ABIH59_03030 [archaeon]
MVKRKRGPLSQVTLAVSVALFVGGLFLLSPTFTGNVIGGSSGSSIIGIVFVVLGVIGYYFFAKNLL